MAKKFSVEEVDKHPIATDAYNFLAKNGFIKPGAMIPGEMVEQALGKKYIKDGEHPDFWKFLGPFLLLKNKIESEGYFISQKGQNYPGFRILETEEMADYAMSKMMEHIAGNYKIGYIMAAHDITLLNDRNKSKHKSVQQKAAQCALVQHKLIMDNTFF